MTEVPRCLLSYVQPPGSLLPKACPTARDDLHPVFLDEETCSERSSNVSWVTQLARGHAEMPILTSPTLELWLFTARAGDTSGGMRELAVLNPWAQYPARIHSPLILVLSFMCFLRSQSFTKEQPAPTAEKGPPKTCFSIKSKESTGKSSKTNFFKFWKLTKGLQ